MGSIERPGAGAGGASDAGGLAAAGTPAAAGKRTAAGSPDAGGLAAAGASQPASPSGAVRRWEDLVRRRREQFERLRGEARNSADDTYWRRRAGNYYAAVRTRIDPKGTSPVVQASLAACEAAELANAAERATVLDVGGGFGAVAVPIARSGRRVTVVEPSAAMREYLVGWVAEEALGERVEVVAADWMSAVVGRRDVVLCMNVLYPIERVAPFVRKLLASARHSCLLAMRAETAEIAPPELFFQMHGEARIGQPTFGDLREVLRELGLTFEEKLAPVERDWSYADLDEAEEALSETLLVADRPDLRRRVRDWAAANLIEAEGRLLAPSSGPFLEGIAILPAAPRAATAHGRA